MESTINILVASHNEEMQACILTILENESIFSVAGVVKDGTDAIIAADRIKPEVIILDLKLDVESWLNTVRIIHRRSPSSAIIVLNNNDNNDFVSFAFKAGVSGFLLSDEDLDKLSHIIKLVSLGGKYVSASIMDRIYNAVSLTTQLPGQFNEIDYSIFTSVERDIITGLAKGYTDDEIAEDLHLCKGSIRNCITTIRRKTRMKSRIGIVVFSLIYGLVRLEDFGSWNENIKTSIHEHIKNRPIHKKRGRKPKVS